MPDLKPLNPFRSLQELCESNYRKLLRLTPQLPRLEEQAVARLGGKPPLHLRLLERSPYTLTLELSYCFDRCVGPVFEPALKLRVYLDASMVEVVGDCERPRRQIGKGGDRQVLEHKWRLNYFLDKWLDHCLHHGYRFAPLDDRPETAWAGG